MRGMTDGMPHECDPIQGQGHKIFGVSKSISATIY